MDTSPNTRQKPHRVKQFIVGPVVLFCCYVIKHCWARLQSGGDGEFLFHSVSGPSEEQLAFMVSKIKPLMKVFFPPRPCSCEDFASKDIGLIVLQPRG